MCAHTCGCARACFLLPPPLSSKSLTQSGRLGALGHKRTNSNSVDDIKMVELADEDLASCPGPPTLPEIRFVEGLDWHYVTYAASGFRVCV